MYKLPKRLELIYDLVDEKVVADVGCDHGKLAHTLLDTKKCDFVYVSDISAPSLKKAQVLLGRFQNFEAICCDGLKGYKGKKIDECVISGMGGEEIMGIISSSPIEINKFILSPQKNETKVKEFMLGLGYGIEFDKIIFDKGKFYRVFKCVKGSSDKPKDKIELEFGRDSFGTKDFFDFVEYETNKVNNIIFSLAGERKQELTNYLDLLSNASKRKGKK